MLRFIIKQRYVEMLEYINKKKPNMLKLSGYSKTSYGQTITVLKQFQSEGLIKDIFNQNTEERDHTVQLTEKGKKAVSLLRQVLNLGWGPDYEKIQGGKDGKN